MATKPSTPKPQAKGGPKAAARAGKPKLVASANGPALSVVGEDGEAGSKASGLRLKDLVDLVVAATGGKKKGVKDVVEATLTQLGEALARGESLNLPALGKMRVARAGAEGGGAMTLKLRQGAGGGARGKGKKEPLAEAEDQD